MCQFRGVLQRCFGHLYTGILFFKWCFYERGGCVFYGCKYEGESVRRKNGYVSESEVHLFCVLYIFIDFIRGSSMF